MSDETPSGPANVLLEVDGRDDCEEAACMSLSGVDDPAAVDVVFVTFTKSAGQRLDTWREHAEAPPANIGIVSVEMGGAESTELDRDGGPAVRRISDPSDLTGVGIAISEFLSEWADTDQQTVVCFDSVTALLQYVEANRVFQFLNEMTSKFEQAGAHAHFHLMPEAHEPQDLSVLTSLFGEREIAKELVGSGAAGAAAASAAASEPVADVSDPDADDDPAHHEADASESDDVPDETPAETAFVFDADGDEAEAPTAPDDDGDEPEADDSPTEAAVDPSEDIADGSDDPANETDDGTDDGAAATAGGLAGAPQDHVDSAVEEVEGPEPDDGNAAAETADGPTPEPAGKTPAEAGGASAGAPSPGSDDTDADEGGFLPTSYRTATYSRTTATVVGVVAMLVLISVFAGAMPLPVGDDGTNDENAFETATPEPVTGASVNDSTATATATATPTPTPTASPTATDTPTPTPTPDSSTSGSDGSSSTSGSSSTPTATDTPTDSSTPTPEPTATPTPTPEDDSLTDTVDDTTDTVSGDEDEEDDLL